MNDDIRIYEKQFDNPGLQHTGMPVDELYRKAAEEMEKASSLSPRLKKLSTFQFLLEHMRVGVAERDDLFPVFGIWGRKGFDLLYRKNWDSHQEALEGSGDIFTRGDARGMEPDFAHSVPDWQTVLEFGFTGLLKRAKKMEAAYFAEHEKTREKQEFFLSVIHAYASVLNAMTRLTEAQQEVHSEPEIVQGLRNLTIGRAQTTYEALLQIWLFHQIAEYADGIETRSFGNLDQLLYPYYQRDRERGVSEAHFRRMLHNFMAKVMATHYYYGHPMYLGGTNADGSSAVNELSFMILDEYDRAGFHDPKIQVKVNLNTPVPFLNKILDMIRRGHNSIVLVGEPGIRKAMLKHGFSEENARCAVIKGCYEYTELHSSVETAPTQMNMPQIVLNVLRDNPDVPDFETLMVKLEQHVQRICERTLFFINRMESQMESFNPSLMLSGVTESAISRGLDGYSIGPLHNNTNIWCLGPATAGDSLRMVQKYVFEQKKITLPELLKALDANWSGYETLQRQLWLDPEKYGNHMSAADQLLKRYLNAFTRNINGKPNARGGIFTTALHSADMFITCAKRLGATPDGRFSGTECAKNISPQAGQCKHGVTALIQSALVLDPSDFMGDFPVDVTLHPSALCGDDGLEALRKVIMVYIQNFGHAIHFNVFSAEQLKDAAAHPEKYPGLQVRICGWNVWWNRMSAQERSAYIMQAENVAG